MQNLHFPLNFTFKILTPSNDFSVLNAQGETVAYTRQKIFKIKESIEIFRNSSRSERLYTIKADRIIDFNANYTVRNAQDQVIGQIKRSGMKSLWQTSFTIMDAQGQTLYTMREKNPWVAVLDGIVGEIPVIGMLTGYFFNPGYGVTAPDGREVFLLRKQPSFFERKFSLEKTGPASAEDDVLVLNAAMMLMLLERGDG
ncbi:hypothetical protein BWD09_05580 [Neisseria dentiae]|uniref:LURP-one-related family protein n=1 Tax=Neisseria dentiae TaxID=194197 RepID=A0A1X3DBZ0_9NEIS|nr:hypothetical protein [Neisseria dentiae]OSI17459.1 hypothetical protein BWD09_05580 [Neisseria dentiae]QMT45853.1 hypothetical protein H3L92_03335 [Neisseria dentiae]STZ51842.1 Protein of uncharacterised function (DUF567) [Neisseria dentiae]